MKKIAQGLPLKKYIGNKHKDGGIMVNALGNKTKDVNKAVAEVEGGEYNFRYNPNNPKDNYILSEQLGIAGIAKQADRFKGNNRIDYNTRTNLLNKSMKLNEMLRVQQEQQPMQMAAFGGKLKKYKNGSFLLKGSESIVGSMVANSKANDTTKIATAPEIKLGTAMPLSYSDKLIKNPLDLNLNKLTEKDYTNNPKLTKPLDVTKLPTTAPKTTAEAANTGMQVNTQNNATPEPTINKKGVKDVTSGLSSVASAFGPIGQAVGMGIQLAPYAIDLGKAMFDKTSVQDLQTQGSAMRLPNTTYAKNGGKLNVKPLPKFDNGGKPKTRTPKSFKNIGEFSDSLSEEQMKLIKDNPEQFNKDMMNWGKKSTTPIIAPTTVPVTTPIVTPTTSNVTNTKPLKIKTKLEIDKKALAGDKSYLDKKFTTPSYIDSSQEQVDEISRTNAGVTNKMYRSLSKFFNTPRDYRPNSMASSIARFEKDNLEREKEYDALVGNALSKFNSKGVTTPTTNTTPTTTNTPTLETPQSESSRLFKAGQNKQKLSEALMYGMAALPSEQIKTITPDYGRGDDAMSRMGLSTEPIRQEMMQGANKALELTRSQVGTAGQLQSRGQSIMSNVGSQLAQSQMQQQQYLNQLRGALAQREDTKANVLAQSELTAREAKSAERAAKLDQLNNAISQTSAIGAGTMEQASKMSTIENENERFNKQQERLLDIFNKSGNFKVSFDKDGKITYDYVGNTPAQSNIKQVDLSKQPAVNNAANTGTSTTPASNAVVPAATTTGTTHTIKKGDTLYAIAKANNTTVSNLVKLNGFKNDRALILPGQTIKIK
jgi:LysM repeat protein